MTPRSSIGDPVKHTSASTCPADRSAGRLGFGTITVHADDGVSEAKVDITTARSGLGLRGSHRRRVPSVHARRPRPETGARSSTSRLRGRYSGRDALDVDITVPSGTTMKIASWGADVVVTGRSGNVDISSGSTTTELDHVDAICACATAADRPAPSG